MKRSIKLISFCCILFATTACSKDNLILLDNKPMFVDNGEPRVIAKPEDIVVTGDYNRIGRIQWPEMSASIESAIITVSKVGTTSSANNLEDEVTLTVTNFDEDILVSLDELVAYNLAIVYNSKNGSTSKARLFTVTPLDYAVNLISDDFTVTPLSGRVRFDFVRQGTGDYEYIIKYVLNGAPAEQTFQGTTDSLDSHILTGIIDDNLLYDFDVVIRDKNLNITSPSIIKSVTPLALPAVLVERNIAVKSWLDGALIRWTNDSDENVKVTVSYMLNGVRQEISKNSTSINDNIGLSSLPIGAYNISVKIEDNYGSDYDRFLGTISVAAPSSFSTAASKQGWIAAVSSNQGNDGGGAPTLIDGAPGTFWHTPYGGSAPSFPHFATITLPTKYKLTKLYLTIRNHQSANPFKDFELQTSEDGITFTTHQVFVNMVNTPAAVLPFIINNPITTKHVRILFTSSLPSVMPANAGPVPFMQLAEISFDGYKE